MTIPPRPRPPRIGLRELECRLSRGLLNSLNEFYRFDRDFD